MIGEIRTEAEAVAEKNFLSRRKNLPPENYEKVEKFIKEAAQYFTDKVDNCDEDNTTLFELFMTNTAVSYFNSLHGKEYENTCAQLRARAGTYDVISSKDSIGINGVMSNRPDFVNLIPFHCEEEEIFSYYSLALIALFALCMPVSTCGTTVGVKEKVENHEFAFSNVDFLPFVSNSLFHKFKNSQEYTKVLELFLLGDYTFGVYPDIVIQPGSKSFTIASKSISMMSRELLITDPETIFTRMCVYGNREDAYYCKVNPPKMLKKPDAHISVAKDFIAWAKEMDNLS